jgi:hypothetical protein
MPRAAVQQPAAEVRHVEETGACWFSLQLAFCPIAAYT